MILKQSSKKNSTGIWSTRLVWKNRKRKWNINKMLNRCYELVCSVCYNMTVKHGGLAQDAGIWSATAPRLTSNDTVIPQTNKSWEDKKQEEDMLRSRKMSLIGQQIKYQTKRRKWNDCDSISLNVVLHFIRSKT